MIMDNLFDVNFWLQFFSAHPWLKFAVQIFIYFIIAWLIHKFSWLLIKPTLGLLKITAWPDFNNERRKTLEGLINSGISGLSFILAFLFSLGLFVEVSTIIWMVGLFSAAFGLGARPIISDLLTGMSFIFEDTFSVGEKVEVMDIEGVIEEINLRTTLIRSPSGELYVVPNGEIRTIRNFSRGKFSVARVHIKIHSEHLSAALNFLDELNSDALLILPNMIEPWQVLSEEGNLGQNTELTLVVKVRYGKAAELQPRLLSYLHEKFSGQGLDFID